MAPVPTVDAAPDFTHYQHHADMSLHAMPATQWMTTQPSYPSQLDAMAPDHSWGMANMDPMAPVGHDPTRDLAYDHDPFTQYLPYRSQ
jgi:hypothetical protein